ncbi:MAG: hypothetical protein V4447_05175 [Pseudomonadota bacterium]
MTSGRTIKNLILTAFVIGSGFSLPSFAHDRYRDQAQVWRAAPVYQQDIRAYDYVYYPSQQVYFSPSNNNWFWLGGNGWQVSTRLPNHINLDLRFGGVPISLHSERPYFEHAFVERSYGRPWRESYESRSYNNAYHHDDWRYARHHEQRDERGFYRGHDRDNWHERDKHHGHDNH